MRTLPARVAARNSGNDLSRSNSLTDLAARIKAEHLEAERSLQVSVEYAIRAGELLLEAKRKAGHGNWVQWLEQNISFSDRLAQAYMRLARLPLEKRNAVADLPLREALSAIRSRQKLIADSEERMNEPSPGPAVVAAVAEDGSV